MRLILVALFTLTGATTQLRHLTQAKLKSMLKSAIAKVNGEIIKEHKSNKRIRREARHKTKELCQFNQVVLPFKTYIQEMVCPHLRRTLHNQYYCNGRHQPCIRCTSSDMSGNITIGECRQQFRYEIDTGTEIDLLPKLTTSQVCKRNGINQMCAETTTKIIKSSFAPDKKKTTKKVHGLMKENCGRSWDPRRDANDNRKKCCTRRMEKKLPDPRLPRLRCATTYSPVRDIKILGELTRCKADECFRTQQKSNNEKIEIDFKVALPQGCCLSFMEY